MSSTEEYIESGILEMYVFGALTEEERVQVEQMASSHPDVQRELDTISATLHDYAVSFPIEPDTTVKPFLMAIIDYNERLTAGEEPGNPPLLNENSRIEDFSLWIDRKDMGLPADFKDLYAKIIRFTPQTLTAIAWIKEMAPLEVHNDEYERFLIVEGSCYITVEDTPYSLVPGDYFAIPLHKRHAVTVTSAIPCKVILQRVAV